MEQVLEVTQGVLPYKLALEVQVSKCLKKIIGKHKFCHFKSSPNKDVPDRDPFKEVSLAKLLPCWMDGLNTQQPLGCCFVSISTGFYYSIVKGVVNQDFHSSAFLSRTRNLFHPHFWKFQLALTFQSDFPPEPCLSVKPGQKVLEAHS